MNRELPHPFRPPASIPSHVVDEYIDTTLTALEFADAGEVALGYRLLRTELERAEIVAGTYLWREDLLERYRLSLQRYVEKYCGTPVE